jgi:hypothetical protein
MILYQATNALFGIKINLSFFERKEVGLKFDNIGNGSGIIEKHRYAEI